MLDFDEELKNFKPSMEIREAEDAIRDTDLTDMIDILKEMTGAHRPDKGSAGR